MTFEELEKLPFEFRGNSMIKKGSQSAYYNKQYDITIIMEETYNAKGISVSRKFRYKGKQYRRLTLFLEAIKDLEVVA